MATITDVYKIDSQADISGIEEGTQAVHRNSAAIAQAANTAVRASVGLGQFLLGINSIRNSLVGQFALSVASARKNLFGFAVALQTTLASAAATSGGAIGHLSGWLSTRLSAALAFARQHSLALSIALGAVTAAGMILSRGMVIVRAAVRGLALGIKILLASGIFLLIGALMRLPMLLGSMRDTLEGTTDAATGAGAAMDDTAESATNVADNVSDAADTMEDAQKKVKGVFGAFGAVGEGFIQKAGKIIDESMGVAKGAADAAKDAVGSLGEAITGMGRAEGASTSFGQALDRLGKAWQRIKEIFFTALAKGLTPLIEALATVMEDPRFQEFVSLIADQLGNAILNLAGWLTEEGIPAFLDFVDEVNKAGGPIGWLKDKISDFQRRIEDAFNNVVNAAIRVGNFIRETATKFDTAIRNIIGYAGDLKNNIELVVGIIASTIDEKMGKVKEFLRAPWLGLQAFIQGIWDGIHRSLVENINRVIDFINGLIRAYNQIARTLGLGSIREIGRLAIPGGGGGGGGQVQAMPVGNAPTIGNVNITVSVAPGGFATPEEAGQRLSHAFIREMRAQGMRL